MRSNGQSASSQALTVRQRGASRSARSARTQERTDAPPALGSDALARVARSQRIDVEAADHVTVIRVENGVREPAALREVARVHLEIAEVLGRRHLVRP